jgi:hypothetical protein
MGLGNHLIFNSKLLAVSPTQCESQAHKVSHISPSVRQVPMYPVVLVILNFTPVCINVIQHSSSSLE